tara:strand:+ start:244 stop:630 length:387 start_codon:yes stop_codon:yes gene_type:complete
LFLSYYYVCLNEHPINSVRSDNYQLNIEGIFMSDTHCVECDYGQNLEFAGEYIGKAELNKGIEQTLVELWRTDGGEFVSQETHSVGGAGGKKRATHHKSSNHVLSTLGNKSFLADLYDTAGIARTKKI